MPDPKDPTPVKAVRRGDRWVIVGNDGKQVQEAVFASEEAADNAARAVNESWAKAKRERKSKGAPAITEADLERELADAVRVREEAYASGDTVAYAKARAKEKRKRKKKAEVYEAVWDPLKHPRDRLGQFREILGKLLGGGRSLSMFKPNEQDDIHRASKLGLVSIDRSDMVTLTPKGKQSLALGRTGKKIGLPDGGGKGQPAPAKGDRPAMFSMEARAEEVQRRKAAMAEEAKKPHMWVVYGDESAGPVSLHHDEESAQRHAKFSGSKVKAVPVHEPTPEEPKKKKSAKHPGAVASRSASGSSSGSRVDLGSVRSSR